MEPFVMVPVVMTPFKAKRLVDVTESPVAFVKVKDWKLAVPVARMSLTWRPPKRYRRSVVVAPLVEMS